MKTKCGRCGLPLNTHTDAKCSEIVRLERDALLVALEREVQRHGAMVSYAKEVLRWVKDRGAHEVLKNDPFYSR